MAQKKRDSISTPFESTRHNDKRTNIPTEDLRDFVDDDKKAPQPILYPRDPSLDPQLVWKGKDQQDSEDLEVQSVPIYIQEKIQPEAIIEDIRVTARCDSNQPDLFSDFNGIEFQDLIDFYQAEQNWSNRMILGDSLLVMNSLAERERLKGQVQMIYIDPPYGIQFRSNWQVSTRRRDVKDGKVEDVTRQREQIKAYQDTWTLGVHSYLSYLRDRLTVARELLTESGSVFVQIGDENVHFVRCLMDEVFENENFVGEIIFKTRSTSTRKNLSTLNDYILWYSKNISSLKFRRFYEEKSVDLARFNFADIDGEIFSANDTERFDPKDAKYFSSSSLFSTSGGDTSRMPFEFHNKKYTPAPSRGWRCSLQGLLRLTLADRIFNQGNSIRYKYFHDDFPYVDMGNLWNDQMSEQNKSYVVQTSTKAIQRCLLMTTDPGDLVLDPTCGSGTTAYVAEAWGRRWITIDTSRVALTLARTRLMAARYPYYILTDSPEGVMKEAELTNAPNPAVNAKTSGDTKKGFVCERVPHITLKSIANNPEIDDIHAKWQEQLEPLRVEINSLAGKNWEEWEIPHLENESVVARFIAHKTGDAKEAIEKWFELRRERQAEIDAAIARHSENEILYDKPHEDKKKLRVTGPFTVESLSPHRVLSSNAGTNDRLSKPESLPFETMIIENLKKAGVQNTVKAERLKFDWIEPYAGKWIHAEAEYTENGETKRVAVSIGPEHGTVSSEQIKEAAKEAVQGLGFDLLIVCGFAFDPHASEEQTRYGKLTVLSARMNTDLTMGDEVLKKTGASNLFMVFGEPDVEIQVQPEDKVVIEVKGVDVYDPTTGLVRSNSTDDIACWFIDTNYNGESFFVRHAYFTGADKPYDNLKKALKAEIDEDAWAALYRAKSRPFDKPSTGKIAVKVINHYGDEVMMVYDESHWVA